MPITVKIQRKVADGIYHAVGTVSALAPGDKTHTGEATVLLKQVDNNKLQLHLDSSIWQSKLMGREVELFIAPDKQPVEVLEIKEGTEVTFDKIGFKLKK